MTNKEQHIYWEQYGLRLHIPRNSLPEDVNQCRLKIKAALLGNFKLPENSVLVSALYSFSHDLGDKELRRSVTLEIQHCANTGTLHVVRAVGTSTNFEIITGGDFTRSDRFGSINLLRFSSFSIVNILKHLRSFIPPFNHCYCAKMYYTGISHLQFDFEFFIIQDLNAQAEVCDAMVICFVIECMPPSLSKGY